ncbi:MAG: substrate-binding domain-containing protein [Lachnospiraceae bacterium]|nr:substrate-binding domain-containing protein [Lachnospiraceae bacterium]
MKKAFVIFLALILSLSMLSACTGPETTPAKEETTAAPTTKEEPSTEAPPETTPPETVPSETEPPVPVDPDTLMFTEEEYPKVDGSTSTKPLAKSIQEEFTGAENVEIKHSKSHQSYLNLIDGLCDMILAVEPSEDAYTYAAKKGVTMRIEKVTNEGFVFFVNKRNPIDSLTLEQIRGIYSGKITNWKDVGGQDAEIVAFQRPTNSGSQTGMLSLVMGDTPMMEPVTGTVADTMNEIVDVISAFDSGENAIGYSYYYYANTMYLGENVKLIAVEGVKPNNTTIREGDYPLLTAYYAITREGDVTPETSALIRGILSERGQRAVQRAGYVPVIDVGAYDPEHPEASNERTISLNNTYKTNRIRTVVRTDTYEGYEYKYMEVIGLSDPGLLGKINETLHDDALSNLKNGLEQVEKGRELTNSYALLEANFENVLSIQYSCVFGGRDRWFETHFGTNLRLDTGERLTLPDLFKTDTEGKDIFNADFYGDVVFKTAETNSRAGLPVVEDYNDAEDRIFSIIQDYNAGKDFNFYFTPREVVLLDLLTPEKPKLVQYYHVLELWFTHCMEEVTIYHKYADAKVPYDGTVPLSSGFAILTDHGFLYAGITEKTEDYLLDAGLYFDPNLDFSELYMEKAYELYLQYLDDIRAELREKAAAGVYAFYNVGADLSDPSVWGGTEPCMFGIGNFYTELGSREELNDYYDRLVMGIRDPHFEYWGRNSYIYAAYTEETHLKSLKYYFDKAGNILRTEEGGY